MPEYDSYRNGHIQRMLRTELGNLDNHVGSIDDFLADAIHLIPEYECVTPARACPGVPEIRHEILQTDRSDGLFYGDYRIAFLAQPFHNIQRPRRISPWSTFLSSQSRLADFGRRGYRTYSAKPETVRLERITSTERRTHVVGAADVVQYDDETRIRQIPIGTRIHSPQLNIQ